MFTGLPGSQLTGVIGSTFGAPFAGSLLTGAADTPSAGAYAIYAVGADIRVEINTDSGPTWVAWFANGAGGYFETDGVNVRIKNTHNANTETYKLIKIGG